MKITTPSYYRAFQCVAGACPDSCCKEWAVDVDEDSAARYRALPGPLGDRLRQVLEDTEDGTVMAIEDGRCPMWRSDGLCQIQAELGHDALCHTCQKYPRLTHDYGDFLEEDLELSCPEAARLILSGDDTLLRREVPGGKGDYDRLAMDTLLRSRQEILSFLKSTTLPLPKALTVLLLYGHSVQGELDGGEAVFLEPEVLLAEANKYAGSGDTAAVFQFFQGLEVLTAQWAQRLANGPENHSWDPRLFPFARYMIRRYYLQAISDYDLVSRVKFTVTACILLSALGGDILQTSQLFSKEIENDPDNVEAILDGAYCHPALTDRNLLGILQKCSKV